MGAPIVPLSCCCDLWVYQVLNDRKRQRPPKVVTLQRWLSRTGNHVANLDDPEEKVEGRDGGADEES